MRDRHDILERLRGLLCERLGLAGGDLVLEATLEEIGIDSVELAFVFSYFERDTGLIFDDAEIDVSRYTALGDLAEVLAAKVARGANAATGPDV
jgi:acyl carrier protein